MKLKINTYSFALLLLCTPLAATPYEHFQDQPTSSSGMTCQDHVMGLDEFDELVREGENSGVLRDKPVFRIPSTLEVILRRAGGFLVMRFFTMKALINSGIANLQHFFAYIWSFVVSPKNAA